jgi:DNA-binding SARP family transcriptional activator
VRLSIHTLGELTVRRGGEVVSLPASKKTRALLAYLALTGRQHRRDRLCEVLWEMPDDPRAALRWSLNKLRPLVNDEAGERLVGDREHVALQTLDLEIDVRALEARLEHERTVDELSSIANRLKEPLLDGLDLPNQHLFQSWLEAEREEIDALRIRVLERLSRHPDLTASRALKWSRSWLDLDPFNPQAARLVLVQLKRVSRDAEVLSRELTGRFRIAGIEWPRSSTLQRRVNRKK